MKDFSFMNTFMVILSFFILNIRFCPFQFWKLKPLIKVIKSGWYDENRQKKTLFYSRYSVSFGSWKSYSESSSPVIELRCCQHKAYAVQQVSFTQHRYSSTVYTCKWRSQPFFNDVYAWIHSYSHGPPLSSFFLNINGPKGGLNCNSYICKDREWMNK